MDSYSDTGSDQSAGDEYLRRTQGDFSKASESGLYEPKSEAPQHKVDTHVETKPENPTSIRPLGSLEDSIANLINGISVALSACSLFVALLTIVGLGFAAYFAYQQWGTMILTYQQIQIQTAAQLQTAQAAKDSAKTAEETLWAVQGANLSIGRPNILTGWKRVMIPVTNEGHMASGRAEITVQESTWNINPKTGGNSFLEYHWSAKAFPSIPLGQNFNIPIDIPSATPFGIFDGGQMINVGGSIDYQVGIGNAPKRILEFCFSNEPIKGQQAYQSLPCDPIVIHDWEKTEGYPAHQEKWPEEIPLWSYQSSSPLSGRR